MSHQHHHSGAGGGGGYYPPPPGGYASSSYSDQLYDNDTSGNPPTPDQYQPTGYGAYTPNPMSGLSSGYGYGGFVQGQQGQGQGIYHHHQSMNPNQPLSSQGQGQGQAPIVPSSSSARMRYTPRPNVPLQSSLPQYGSQAFSPGFSSASGSTSGFSSPNPSTSSGGTNPNPYPLPPQTPKPFPTSPTMTTTSPTSPIATTTTSRSSRQLSPYPPQGPSTGSFQGVVLQMEDPSKPPKTLQCDGCDARFARKHDLNRHRRIHTQEAPYACLGCLKTFRRSDARKRHWEVEVGCYRRHVEVEDLPV